MNGVIIKNCAGQWFLQGSYYFLYSWPLIFTSKILQIIGFVETKVWSFDGGFLFRDNMRPNIIFDISVTITER